jgi:hypothetical protein
MAKLGVVAAVPLEPEKRKYDNTRRSSGSAGSGNGSAAPQHPKTERKLTNWLLGYQEYTSDLESPAVFHMWAALFAIAAVTVRKIYIPTKFGPIFTNIYVGFVGKPATRKTTAIDTAYRLAAKVVPQHALPNAGSAAALVASLADMKDMPTQAGNLVSNELGSLIRQGDTDTVSTLTDLYDCKEDQKKRTISRGYEILAKPWLNFIFGTTQEWLGANLPSSSAEGGFFSRIVFVFCDDIKLTSPLPEETDQSAIMRAALINDLIHINSLEGAVTLTPEARATYEAWYFDTNRPGYNATTDPRTNGYYVRKHIHILKVAMLLMLAERDDLVLTQKDIEMALTVLASIERGIGSAVGSVGRNELLTHSQNVLRQIQSAGPSGISYQAVLRKHIHNIKRSELDEIISTFVSTGDVIKKHAVDPSKAMLIFTVQRP